MQPYFLPYIGYFQLINAVDKFVIYDNIQYTKKGWINRNRILVNGKDEYITIPLKKDSDYLDIVEREIAEDFNQGKLLRKIQEVYRKAPEFKNVYPLIEHIINHEEKNLFNFIHNSILNICNFLEITTEFIISSSVLIESDLKSEEKVIAICIAENTVHYINPIGGLDLYSREEFKRNGIQLGFIQSKPIIYSQFQNEFVPWLSIVDVMMFNSKSTIQKFLNEFTIV